jgi:hypothetical protein
MGTKEGGSATVVDASTTLVAVPGLLVGLPRVVDNVWVSTLALCSVRTLWIGRLSVSKVSWPPSRRDGTASAGLLAAGKSGRDGTRPAALAAGSVCSLALVTEALLGASPSRPGGGEDGSFFSSLRHGIRMRFRGGIGGGASAGGVSTVDIRVGMVSIFCIISTRCTAASVSFYSPNISPQQELNM